MAMQSPHKGVSHIPGNECLHKGIVQDHLFCWNPIGLIACKLLIPRPQNTISMVEVQDDVDSILSKSDVMLNFTIEVI